MEKRRRFTPRFLAAGFAVLFIFAILTPDTRSYASRRHHPPPSARHHHSHIRTRPLLPLGFALLTIAGCQYYYHKGMYYRPLPRGYIVTTPPVGAVVVELPPGYVTFRTGGVTYYYYGNVYYTRVPSGYVVVNPPYEDPPTESLAQSASSAISQITVIPPMLNVRSGPGAEHAIILQVPQGTILEIHGTAPEWLFVKLPSGGFGWVMEKFTFSQPVVHRVPAEG